MWFVNVNAVHLKKISFSKKKTEFVLIAELEGVFGDN